MIKRIFKNVQVKPQKRILELDDLRGAKSSPRRVKLMISKVRMANVNFPNTGWLFQHLVLQPSTTKTLPHKPKTAGNSPMVPQSGPNRHFWFVKTDPVLCGEDTHRIFQHRNLHTINIQLAFH